MENNDIFFSVTIPAYKAKFLKECIDSILSQTYENFELVIVDDNSPEDLYSIVSEYSDTRIRYYKNKKNCGAINVVDNWNICLSYAKGDYIICMGDDDMLSPNALYEYYKMINKYPDVNVLHSRVMIIDQYNNNVRITNDRAEFESVYSFIMHRVEGRIQFIGDFCFKTKVLKRNGGFYKLPLAWGSDDITSIIAAKEYGIANINEPTFLYRTNGLTISTSSKFYSIKLKAIDEEQKWYDSFISQLNPDNVIDSETLKQIRKRYRNSFIRKKARIISLDMEGNVFNFIKWLFKKNKYNLNYKILGLALIKYAQEKANK